MKITDIAFTGYSVTNMKRARKFYEEVLGLEKSRSFGEFDGDDHWVEYDIGTGCLALITGGGKDWPPSPAGAAAALEVADFDNALATIKQKRVRVVFPAREAPSCRMIVVADPDGNWIVLHSRHARA